MVSFAFTSSVMDASATWTTFMHYLRILAPDPRCAGCGRFTQSSFHSGFCRSFSKSGENLCPALFIDLEASESFHRANTMFGARRGHESRLCSGSAHEVWRIVALPSPKVFENVGTRPHVGDHDLCDSSRACSAGTRPLEVRQTIKSIVFFVLSSDGERSALYGRHVPRLQEQGRGYCPLVLRTASCHRVASTSPAARCKPFRGQLTASSNKHDWQQKDEWTFGAGPGSGHGTCEQIRVRHSPSIEESCSSVPSLFGRQPLAFSPDSASSYIPAHRLVGVFCSQRAAPPRPLIGAPRSTATSLADCCC